MLLLGKSDLGCGSQREESTEPVTAWPGCLSFPVSAGSGAEGASRALLSLLEWGEKLNQEHPGATPAQGISPESLSHLPRVNQEFVFLKHMGGGFEMEVEGSVEEREPSSGLEPW